MNKCPNPSCGSGLLTTDAFCGKCGSRTVVSHITHRHTLPLPLPPQAEAMSEDDRTRAALIPPAIFRPREQGLYLVKFLGQITVACRGVDDWQVAGEANSYWDCDFDHIGPKLSQELVDLMSKDSRESIAIDYPEVEKGEG